MKVILFEPSIPDNTGNIIRTCHATNSGLILIPPLGFSLSERRLKRAHLDYRERVPIEKVESLEEYLEKNPFPFYFFSSKAKKNYTEVPYTKETLLIFGSETKGLPPHFSEKFEEHFVTIPMRETTRCLNLANAVAIALYEAHRQTNFSF